MRLIDGKIRLNDLSARLGVTGQSLRLHLQNHSGLGVDAVKEGNKQTGDYLLSIDSVINYLNWAFSHSKKLDFGIINEVLTEVKWLKNQ